MSEPGASGVARERTALAWTRTALALMATALLAGRIVLDRLGVLALALTAVAVPLAATVLVLAARRYRATLHADSPQPDGRLLALVSTLVVVLAVTEAAYVFRG
jgi:putative membrane protein